MKKIFLTLPFIVFLLIILVGCSTASTATKREFTTLTSNGVQLDISYINNRQLITLYGNQNNPFLRNPNGPVIALEVVGRTSDNTVYTIDMYEVTLESERGVSQPLSKKWMLSYWENALTGGSSPRNSKSTIYAGWSDKLTQQKINSEVLPEVWEVMPGEETRGLITFDPLRGLRTPITARIPIYEPSGAVIATFEYTFIQ